MARVGPAYNPSFQMLLLAVVSLAHPSARSSIGYNMSYMLYLENTGSTYLRFQDAQQDRSPGLGDDRHDVISSLPLIHSVTSIDSPRVRREPPHR